MLHAIKLPALAETNMNRYFNPQIFGEVESAVIEGQDRALTIAGDDRRRWRFSGNTDLASLMVYNGVPDWLSLVSLELEMPLGELTEKLTGWETGDVDQTLAPGEIPYSGSPLPLPRALIWSAQAVAGGMLSNGVWELLSHIAHG